jgi:hypothetical protein
MCGHFVRNLSLVLFARGLVWVFIFWVFECCRECFDVFEAACPEAITAVCAFDDNAAFAIKDNELFLIFLE